MMLVIEVVTTALLLVAGAAAQKPTTLDRSPVNTSQVREGLGIDRQPSSALTETLRLHDRTKTSQLEFPPDEYLNLNISPHSSESVEADDMSNDFELKENTDRTERRKRKVIFGGGSYGHSGRRGGGAVGGDPYGRRRDHYGPNTGPQESWPYRQPDIPYVDTPVGSSPSISVGPTRRSDYVIITRTTVATPTDIGSRSSSIVVPGRREDDSVGRRRSSKSGGYEAPKKKKLTKNVKWEIAKYALQHGTQEAGDHYEDILGRKLPPRKVEKFIQRYQKQQKRDRGYHQ